MLTLIGAAALGLLFIVVAHAHGVGQWIADQQLSDPVLRTYWCGPSDCRQLSVTRNVRFRGKAEMDRTLRNVRF
jgi:hypothetical protein